MRKATLSASCLRHPATLLLTGSVPHAAQLGRPTSLDLPCEAKSQAPACQCEDFSFADARLAGKSSYMGFFAG